MTGVPWLPSWICKLAHFLGQSIRDLEDLDEYWRLKSVWVNFVLEYAN